MSQNREIKKYRTHRLEFYNKYKHESMLRIRVRGSFPVLGFLKETKVFLPHPLVKLSILGSLCDREVACSAADLQGGLNFKSCGDVWREVSFHSSHHPKEVLPTQFSLYSFHLYDNCSENVKERAARGPARN